MRGTNTSGKIVNKQSTDPIERVIFERLLRIKSVIVDKELDLLAMVLTNGNIIKSRLSFFGKLKKASGKKLHNWRLVSNGAGVAWPDLNEDLSLKGFIKSTALNKILSDLQDQGNEERIIA